MNRPILLLLILLSSLTQAAYSQQHEGASMRLTIPKAPWTMFISGDALVLDIEKIEPNGSRGYFMMTDEKAQVFASLFIEPANKCKTSKECRDLVWKSGNPAWQKPQNVKLSEIGEISILEFLVPESRGRPIRQHNMYAQFVVEGYWVDLHISKVLYQDRDRPLFERMVKSVRFEPKKGDVADDRQSQSGADERIAKETMQIFAQASAAYLKRDYKNAIQLYSKVLDLEAKQATLDKNIWRVVVDNLGMSYGISGDAKKAKEVFEYGLSKDGVYPLFYYNLACAHAEMNDLDNAIKNLRLAFNYKANVIPGEQMPDPAGDDSFARFLSNPQFRKLLEEIGASGKGESFQGVSQKQTTEDGATNFVSGKLLDPNGPIKEAEVYLNSLKDEKCVKLFLSKEYSERNLQRLKACVINVGPIKPDEGGAYKFTNLKPGYYALVVSWNLKEKFEKPIMAFQKGDFTISYFEGAKYNAIATGKVFYLSASENATKDFDYTKGEITGKIAPR
jgi:tetratricopeptide (TPR) repeat protein